MATLTSNYLTLADRINQTEPNGEIAKTIVELLNITNPILEDAYADECNDGSTNETTVRTSLPTAAFRDFYGYIPASKSGTAKVTDKTGMINALSVIDHDLFKKAKNKDQFRLNEAMSFFEAMNQTFTTNFFYGNAATNPAGFDGLAPRYNKYQSTDDSKATYNVINAGGSGSDNTSIWFVTYGDLHTKLLYPQGSQAGIQTNPGDSEKPTWETNAEGGKRPVIQDHYQHDVGLCIRDWRSTARIANIDVSDLAAGTVAIDDFMIDAFYRIDEFAQTGKTFIYANKTTVAALHKIAKTKANVHLSIDEFAGKKVVSFLGIPIRTCRTILNTEAAVAAA